MAKKRKYIIIIVAILCSICVWQLSTFVFQQKKSLSGVVEEETISQNKESIDEILKQTERYILSLNNNLVYGNEWSVLGLARSGINIDSPYFDGYYENIVEYIQQNEGIIYRTKCTENSKMILTLTSLGRDAENVEGYNLFANLADFNAVMRQGINGPIWTLIALNSNPKYSIPKISEVEIQTTEQRLLDAVLKAELSDGGWSLSGKTLDVDITAMVLQSLAPYYKSEKYDNVTAAVDRGLKILSKIQNSDTGGFENAGIENCESCVQVITALTSLGIDPKTDSRFVKSGHDPIENLLSYYVTDGRFIHMKNPSDREKVNGMATEQAFYALVSYKRFLGGQKSLYDISDIKFVN